MKRVKRAGICFFLIISVVFSPLRILAIEPANESTNETTTPSENDTAGKSTRSDGLDLESKSAVLMEGSTGKIVFQKNANRKLPPASITKVMTLLLIFEALESKKIALDDKVTTSEYAASMGGSQVFLEPGEQQTVQDMIKCISIASANDASVAMAEHIAGSEAAFVKTMNDKAKTLGMNDTTFKNACGLDVDGHVSSAYDIALMSRELSINHPEVHKYCTIWQDTINHVTKKGTTEFTLTNTNKLIKQYPNATGLKTGSTGLAKFCLAATAKKNNMELISVIMAAENPTIRFNEASKLLDYGFANIQLFKDQHKALQLKNVPVKKSITDKVACKPSHDFSYLLTSGENPNQITTKVSYNENVSAPVYAGDPVGKIHYSIGDKEIGSVSLLATENAEKSSFSDYFTKLLTDFITSSIRKPLK